ncbi:MAG TPA: HupE/UreJ family protein [Candidatus Polarisedimenticolaceae bacterium]|nr:HupE/UreJ family protein [Candidatus Polarisedimenticolaceae bacterium]
MWHTSCKSAARLALVLLPLAAGSPARAHDLAVGKAALAVEPGGALRVELSFDLEAYLLGLDPGHAEPERRAELLGLALPALEQRLEQTRLRFIEELRLDVDGVPLAGADLELPEPLELLGDGAPRAGPPQPFAITLRAQLPAGARSFALSFPPGAGTISLTLPAATGAPAVTELLKAGERSTPLDARTGATAVLGGWDVARRYLALGFEHILPRGLDHILFVLALFFLGTGLRPLLWQVTAFTLAHSITLALSVYGVFSLSPRVVEPLIALSIAFVAVENLLTSRLHAWRPLVVFGFGLLHGLGFASVLLDLGLPRADFLTALITFNVGVELGQLSVITLAALAVARWRGRAWYRGRIAVPASAAIALTGLYWTIERVFF